MRKLAGLVVVLALAGLVAGQEKDKGKKEAPRVKAKLVKVDVKAQMLTVEIDGKQQTLSAKDAKIVGPKGGKATIKDDRLTAGAELGLVMDGKVLKEVHLPFRTKEKPKAKDKDKK